MTPPNNRSKTVKKSLQFIAGLAIIIVGIALVLLWWREVVVLFKGAGGIALALAGLLIMFLAKD